MLPTLSGFSSLHFFGRAAAAIQKNENTTGLLYTLQEIMAFNPRSYETVYGFSLLDELHNFFPEIMYDEALFTSPTLMYMRHRMRTLFPAAYPRQHSIYRIYLSQERQALMSQWRLQTMRDQALVQEVVAPVQVRAAQAPAASPAPVMPAAAAESSPVRTPASRRVVSTPPAAPRQGRGRSLLSDPMEDLLSVLLTAAGSSRSSGTTLEVPLWETSIRGGLFGSSLLANWQDVIVAPTAEEIAAGSELVEHMDVPEETNCAICMERGESQQWRKLRCSHYFHKRCVDTWFQLNVNCPVCRADIREDAAEDEEDEEETSTSA